MLALKPLKMLGKSQISSSSLVSVLQVWITFSAAYLTGFVVMFIYLSQPEFPECPCHQQEQGDLEGLDVSRHEKQSVKQLGEDVIADVLYNKVRVLCMIITTPDNLYNKTINIKATWGRRCNQIIYFSSQEDPTFPMVKVDVPEGRPHIWKKVRGAFQYIYEHHLNDAEWFLKADDDTYVILENLRYLLANFNSNDAMYFGRKFKHQGKQLYMSGGAGYVLSRSALISLVEKAFKDPSLCNLEGESEDIEMGLCLQGVGVVAGDSRDEGLRDRFHPFNAYIHLDPGKKMKESWFFRYSFYPTSWGPECCSDYSISFHYISPNTMYLLEYMIYHMRPFGIGHYTCPANMDTVLKQLPADASHKIKTDEVKGQEATELEVKRDAVLLME